MFFIFGVKTQLKAMHVHLIKKFCKANIYKTASLCQNDMNAAALCQYSGQYFVGFFGYKNGKSLTSAFSNNKENIFFVDGQ